MHRSEDRPADRPPRLWAALATALAVTAAPTCVAAQQAAPTAPVAAEAAATDEVLVEADTVENDDHAHTVTARGDVQARFNDRTVRADSLIYNLETHEILARGNVEIAEADGSTSYADEMQLNEALDIGLVANLRSRFASGGVLAARTAVRRGPGSNELSRIIYTSCPICETSHRAPTWALRARRATQNTNTHSITYRDMTLDFVGVPVFYMPYFGHPDPSAGAHSGLLAPDFGRNRRVGVFYQQPYYFAISPYQDLTASVQVNSQVHPLFGLDYRKRFYSGDIRLDSSLTYEQDFDGNGDTFGDETLRGHIFGSGLFQIDPYWKWGFGVERTSDDLYLRRYDIGGAGSARGPYVGDQSRLISQLYAIGQDPHSFASVAFVSFQGLREGDSSQLMPLLLPTADYERVFEDPWLHGQVRWTSNAAVLSREQSNIDARVSSGVTWRRDILTGGGVVVSPFALARADVFHTEATAADDDTFTRRSALAGAEASLPFIRPGRTVDVIVEPVIMAAYASQGGDDPRIVNEDSVDFELDESSLFRMSGTPNYDLWEPGGRISAGMRATARAANGQSVSVTFGRRWRSETDSQFTPISNLNGRSSDYVGSAQVDLGRHFQGEFRARLDDGDLKPLRLDAGVAASLWRLTSYTRYYRIDHSLIGPTLATTTPAEELTTDIGLRLFGGWRVQYGLRRDLDSDTTLSQDLRAIYEDDCTYLEFAYTRSETFDRRLGPNEGFQIRIGLRTLGVIGGGGQTGGR